MCVCEENVQELVLSFHLISAMLHTPGWLSLRSQAILPPISKQESCVQLFTWLLGTGLRLSGLCDKYCYPLRHVASPFVLLTF